MWRPIGCWPAKPRVGAMLSSSQGLCCSASGTSSPSPPPPPPPPTCFPSSSYWLSPFPPPWVHPLSRRWTQTGRITTDQNPDRRLTERWLTKKWLVLHPVTILFFFFFSKEDLLTRKKFEPLASLPFFCPGFITAGFTLRPPLIILLLFQVCTLRSLISSKDLISPSQLPSSSNVPGAFRSHFLGK